MKRLKWYHLVGICLWVMVFVWIFGGYAMQGTCARTAYYATAPRPW